MEHLDSQTQSSDSQELDLISDQDLNQHTQFTIPNQSNNQLLDDSQPANIPQEITQKVHREYQLIYIAAYGPFYRQLLQEIASKHNCELSFVKNSYTVSCKAKSNYTKWKICKQKINEQFSKIIYLKLEDNQKKHKIYLSPQINRFANQMNIYFCQFNTEIYIHTNKYTEEQLVEKKKEIYKYCNIFTISFSRKKSLENIDLQIVKFYKTVINQYYAERFNKNNLVVEINRNQRTFYILGKPGSKAFQMMEAKKTLKSLIEGVTVVAFKNHKLDSKGQIKLQVYLKEICKFPAIMAKLSQNVIILISKDGILKQLLKRKEKMKSKLGIIQSTSMGIFIPNCYSRNQKKQQMNKICKQMGYDYWGIKGIFYFKTMIAAFDQVKDPMETLELIIQIIGGFMDVKDKYEIMKEKQQPENKMDALKKKELQQQSKYAYMMKNASKDYKELTSILRRDVLQDEVLMKKRYNVIYSILEGSEIGPYYIQKSQYDKGVDRGDIKLIEQKHLKKGEYFETYLKIDNKSLQNKSIEIIELALIQELKRLKQAAKNNMPQGKSFDKERKIAHMIKKLIVVF